MFNDLNVASLSIHPHQAYEIEMLVRNQEKQNAVMAHAYKANISRGKPKSDRSHVVL